MQRRKSTIFHCIYNQPYDVNSKVKLYQSTKSSLQMMQRMYLIKKLKVHNGCVNSICWNNVGDLILSGSDDQHLVLTNAFNYQVQANYKTSHRANIFSAKFLPNIGDCRIISCSGDGIILYTDLMRKTETYHNQFTCHSGTTYEIATVPCESYNFLSCGEDGTVRWFDLRIKDKCSASRCKEDVLISCPRAVTAISVNPILSYQIAIGCSDSIVKIFDRRMLGTKATGWLGNNISAKPLNSFTVPEFEGNSYRITSLSYSPDGQDVLVSYSSDHLYLFSIKDSANTQLKKGIVTSKGKGKKFSLRSPQPVRRLRLRGDWSDTGPDARPEREGGRQGGTEIAQARPVLHTSLMQRMTDVLSRMLNDPATRAALSGGGEDSLEGASDHQGENSLQNNDASSTYANEESTSNVDERELHHSNNETTNFIATNATRTEDIENKQMATKRKIDETTFYSEVSFSCERSENEQNLPIKSETRQMEEREILKSSSACDKVSQNEIICQQSLRQAETSNISENNMIENLQDRLTTMRDGFLERHGSEPAVKLTYSDRSFTKATISFGVADEVRKDSFYPGADEQLNYDITNPGPSSSRYVRQENQFTNEDIYNDSDDEEIISSRRVTKLNPIETEINKTIETTENQENLDGSFLSDFCLKQKFTGHRNARTMIKEANFWGDDFVMSGSDCGHVFIWNRETAKLCMLLEADQHVVNCLQPHPFMPILATSGIDYDVKLWIPNDDETNFDEKFADDLMKRNAVMLEETKDTITVPAVFMIRMLACLNQIRRGGRGRNRRRNEDEE